MFLLLGPAPLDEALPSVIVEYEVIALGRDVRSSFTGGESLVMSSSGDEARK
jgi:hypothetical protein